MSALQERLARLLALATVREGDDDARKNEARNAAVLLLKTCQDNGVKLKFILPGAPKSDPVVSEPHFRRPDPSTHRNYSNDVPDFSRTSPSDDFFRGGYDIKFGRASSASGGRAPSFQDVLDAINGIGRPCRRCRKPMLKGQSLQVDFTGAYIRHTEC